MHSYDFFLTGSLEKVLPARRPRPLDNGKVIPVFPGTIPAFQLVYARFRTEKRNYGVPVTVSVEGAPVQPVLRNVELVPVDFPANEKSDEGYITREPALLPDLLTPLWDNTIYPQPDQYNAVWIDFPGIGAAHKGRYDLTITLSNGDPDPLSGVPRYTEDLHLTLEVLGEGLPPQTLLHTQWFHTDCLASYYHVEPLGEEHWKIIDAFMEPMTARYGINTVLTPVFTPPLDTAVGTERPTVQLVDITVQGDSYSFGFEKLERWCGLCKKHGITHLEIAHFFSQWGAKTTPRS